MTRNLVRIALVSVAMSALMFAQAGTPTPGGGAVAAPSTTKVGIVNIQAVVANSNEGKRDLEALDKKYDGRVKELQTLQTDIENLTKQLNTQGDKLNADARANLERQIADKTKQFQRGREDYQNEVQGQEQEIFQRIAPKVMQTLDQYAKNNGYSLILDWGVLQNGVLWAAQNGIDVTPAVIEAYNSASGVAAPAGGAKPAGTGAATTPRTTSPARPAGTGAASPTTPKK